MKDKIILLVIGFLGGAISFHIFFPKYAQEFFSNIPVELTEVKEITVQENEAIINLIEKVEKSVIEVKTPNRKGAGIILSSDGLILTLTELGSPLSLRYPYKVEKRGSELLLIKVEGNGHSTLAFADDVKLGERVFLVGVNSVNEGIVKQIEGDKIITNMSDNRDLTGSALFNSRGQLVGINTVVNDKIVAISIKAIRDFVAL